MRLLPFALLIPLLAAIPDAAPARAQAVAEATAAPELAERDVLFAYHRMAGTEPDFRALAELELASRPPRTYAVRDEEAERRYLLAIETRRQRAAFRDFDLDEPLTVVIEAEILGHDPALGGIPIDPGAFRSFSLRDPTERGRGFNLRFRNAGAIAVIPAPDAVDAALLLEGAGLASLGRWAGRGRIVVSFVFAGALPRADGMEETPLLLEILSARVESAGGLLLHAFGGAGSREAAAAARQAGPPPLRAARIAGLRIGMALEAARRVAAASHPVALGGAFFDGLSWAAGPGRGVPDCSAGVVADIRAFGIPLSPVNAHAGCLAITGGEEDGVTAMTQLRFLPGGTLVEARAELQERFGPPLEELPGGEFVWIGRDPEGEAGGLLELRAGYVRVEEGGPALEEGVLLALTLQPHRPPGEDGP